MNVTEQLHDLVADEPPYRLDPDAAMTGGRRRSRTRTTVLALAAGTTGVVALSAALALQPSDPNVRQTLFGAPSTAAPEPQGPIEMTVRVHTPKTWTLTNADETESSGFQADVDDGAGASRLYVGVSPSPGTLQQHPCADHEFALDSVCTERQLDADTRLIMRGPAASGPVTSAYVVIVHRDGSGVEVGNDTATWPPPPVGGDTPAQTRSHPPPMITGPRPVYSMAQLVEIAKAVDAATSGR